MKNFYIDVYELYSQTICVKANTKDEAIEMYKNGKGRIVDDSLDYIEIADRYGMDEDHMGIRSVDEVEED